jgi:hypothetical protein
LKGLGFQPSRKNGEINAALAAEVVTIAEQLLSPRP